MPEVTLPSHQHARVLAAARQLPRTEREWDDLGGAEQAELLAQASRFVDAIDAADNRIRLTLPEFHAIQADAFYTLGHLIHSEYSGEQLRAIQATGVTEFIYEQQKRLSEPHNDPDPKNADEAMESLIRERVAAELNFIADCLDHGSLDEITAGLDVDRTPGISPRFKRRMIAGCADWIRNRAIAIITPTHRLHGRINR